MPPLRRNDFRRLARARAVDAQTLFTAGRYAGAYYLAGYSIECAIKACIANQTRRYEFPDKARQVEAFQHKLNKLVKAVPRIDTALQADWASDAQFAARWNIVAGWDVDSRYDLTITRRKAAAMLDAVTISPGGVLEWFQHHWQL